MKINLRTGAWYGDNILSIKVPDNSEINYFRPKDAKAINLKILHDKIENYIAEINLIEILQEKKKICLVVDDITRPTPVKEILEILIDKILNVNPITEVCILIANGAHKPMSGEEIGKKFGNNILGKVKIINHNFMSDDFVFCEEVLNGPVILNKYFVNADIRITIGGILPHNETGFGGGAKLVVPGLSSADTIAYFHGALMPRKVGLIDGDNKIDRRDWAEKVASKFNIISFFILVNSDREIVDVYCGDIIKTHRIAAEKCKEIGQTNITRKDFNNADFCIINCYPLDTDPIQMGKAIFSISKYFTKKILLVNSASDGKFYHGMGMGSGIDFKRLSKNFKRIFILKNFNRYLKTVVRLFHKPYLFVRYTYFYFNMLSYNNFTVSKKRELKNLSPDEKSNLILFSRNFPPSNLLKKYPGAKLLRNKEELESYLEVYAQNKKIIVFPCAPIQLINLVD